MVRSMARTWRQAHDKPLSGMKGDGTATGITRRPDRAPASQGVAAIHCPLITPPDAPAMAGLNPESPQPASITVHQKSRVLEIGFSDGAVFRIPFELMRVYSPSAEVQGHGPGQEILQTGKREVQVLALEPVGNYAVQPRFSDGHDSGIFSWDYLYFLGSEQARLWREYEARLAAAGVDRDAPMKGRPSAACHSH